MKTRKLSWNQVAKCDCGWIGKCAHGDLFHLTYQGAHINVCPKCGVNKDIGMIITTVREIRIKKSWWRPYQFSHWEFKLEDRAYSPKLGGQKEWAKKAKLCKGIYEQG